MPGERTNVFQAALQAMTKDERDQFLTSSLSFLDGKEATSNVPDELQFITIFRKYLEQIINVDEIPRSWFATVFYLYDNKNYTLFSEWLRTIPQPPRTVSP